MDILNRDESVRVGSFRQAFAVFDRVAVDPSRFIRRVGVGRRVPIQAFGTGIDVEGIGYDRHWQVVAVSSVPDFQPRAACMAGTVNSWFVNGTGQSQWVTTLVDPDRPLPAGATFTFRTTFELDNVLPETAVMRGWFLTNGHVEAIRLNGRERGGS